MPFSQTDYPPGSALYADLREKWKHEDELIHQRVTWLLHSQAFLLTAFGALAKLRLDVEATSNHLLAMVDNLIWVLYTLGESLIVVCAVVVTYYLRHGITAAITAMGEIKAQLREHQWHGRVWSSVRVDIVEGTTVAGASPSRTLATTFLCVWLLCLWYESYRSASLGLQLLTLR